MLPASCLTYTSHIIKPYPFHCLPTAPRKARKKTLAKGRRRAPPLATQHNSQAAAVLGAPDGQRRSPWACCCCPEERLPVARARPSLPLLRHPSRRTRRVPPRHRRRRRQRRCRIDAPPSFFVGTDPHRPPQVPGARDPIAGLAIYVPRKTPQAAATCAPACGRPRGTTQSPRRLGRLLGEVSFIRRACTCVGEELVSATVDGRLGGCTCGGEELVVVGVVG